VGGKRDEEEASFAELIGEVRRLHYDGLPPEELRPRAQPRRRPPAAARAAADDEVSAGGFVIREHPEAAPASHQRDGVQRGVLRRLQRGHYPVEDDLDLHGLTLREAALRLAAFLEGARTTRLRCVRVIHGKGLSSPGAKPILKPQVLLWLRDHPWVLAYTSARDEHGGGGAVYVLLRSHSG